MYMLLIYSYEATMSCFVKLNTRLHNNYHFPAFTHFFVCVPVAFTVTVDGELSQGCWRVLTCHSNRSAKQERKKHGPKIQTNFPRDPLMEAQARCGHKQPFICAGFRAFGLGQREDSDHLTKHKTIIYISITKPTAEHKTKEMNTLPHVHH